MSDEQAAVDIGYGEVADNALEQMRDLIAGSNPEQLHERMFQIGSLSALLQIADHLHDVNFHLSEIRQELRRA